MSPMSGQEDYRIIVFVVLVFIFGALSRLLVRGTRIPYSIVMFIIGFGYGIIGIYVPALATYETLTKAKDPEIVFYIFLPVLLFESALNLPVHVFRNVAGPCLFLACPGLVVASLLTAVGMVCIFPSWSMSICLLFGFIVSATDPVAVVALLRELGTPEKVSVLIEGESLFNDGTSIMGYSVLLAVATSQFHGGFLDVVWMFIATFGGGCLMGVVCGAVFVRMFAFAVYDPLVEIILSFAAAYGTFYMAQHVCGVSGVVAIVVCGLYISLNYEACIAPESQDLMRKVWDVAVLMANTVIFALIGVMVAEIVWYDAEMGLAHIARCAATYLLVNVVRALIVLLSYPLLRSSLGWKGCVLVSWGGLRGAVSLVLAFMVSKHDGIPEGIRRHFLSQTANVVVSTLIINGWFTKNLVHYLRLDQVSDAKLIRHRAAVRIVKEALEQSLGKLHEDELLGHANWNVVSRYAVGVLDQDLALANVSTTDFREMARVTFLDAIQSSISAQYKLGLLCVFGVSTLTNRLHECLENPDQPLRLSLSKEMFDIPVWQTMMAQTPVFGVFFRQAITESWAAYYNMAIAYILAINSAIRVCEQRDLVRANSAWNFFRDATIHHNDPEPQNPGPSEGFVSSPTAYHPAQKYKTQCLFSNELKEVMTQYRKLRDEVQTELQQLKRRNPSLARAVETHHAIRSVLNHGLYTVDELHEEGVIDRSTQETLLHSLQQRITSASPGAFLPIASPLMFGLMSTDEAGLLPETSPLL